MNKFACLGVSVVFCAAAIAQSAPTSASSQTLVQAIVQNDIAAARRAIEDGAEIDRNIFGATPLHIAAEYGRTEIAQLLLDKGASVDPIDNLARTPLLWATENRHIELARLLVSHGANVNQADTSRFRGPLETTPRDTPLDYALLTGDTELCRLLIEAGAKVGKDDFPRLQRAIESGKPELLTMLIAKGVDPMAHSKEGGNGFATAGMNKNVEMIKILVSRSRNSAALRFLLNDALQHAAEYGNTTVVRFLLDSTNVDLDREGESNYGGVERVSDTKNKVPGFTALSRAVEQGHEDIIEALLQKGAHVTGRTRSGAPILNFVISQNRDDLFRVLMKFNPPLSDADYDGKTALMTAAQNGKLEVVKALVEKGASVDRRDHAGSTALMLASETGQTTLADYLVGRGGSLSDRDSEGRDALIRGAMGGHSGICSLLITKGAKVNAIQPKTGMTALHWAAKNANPAAIKELLASAASAEIADKEGKKPLDYARLAGDPETIALLASQVSGSSTPH